MLSTIERHSLDHLSSYLHRVFGSRSPNRLRVAVGMSGGVDSSVAAYLCKQVGLDVVGVFMRNWDTADEQGESVCTISQDREDARNACRALGIPFAEADFVRQYWTEVFSQMLADMEDRGWTPNPDILCNRHIKFDAFHRHCLQSLGVDAVATGHYAKLLATDTNNDVVLARADAAAKDQSYFLAGVRREVLPRCIFPLGHIASKADVRAIAEHLALPTAAKKESMGICFVGKRPFAEFIRPYLDRIRRGSFVDVDTGRRLGQHDGTAFYTLGQRAGIGGAAQRVFVVDKDESKGIVYVAQGENHPSLFCRSVETRGFSWLVQPTPSSVGKAAAQDGEYPWQYQVRYRQNPVGNCRIHYANEGSDLRAEFQWPQRAATPGQWLVLYSPEGICLGGGQIASRGASLFAQGQRELVTQFVP